MPGNMSAPPEDNRAWVCYQGEYFYCGKSGSKPVTRCHDSVYNKYLKGIVGTSDKPTEAIMDCTQGPGGMATQQRQARFTDKTWTKHLVTAKREEKAKARKVKKP